MKEFVIENFTRVNGCKALVAMADIRLVGSDVVLNNARLHRTKRGLELHIPKHKNGEFYVPDWELLDADMKKAVQDELIKRYG